MKSLTNLCNAHGLSMELDGNVYRFYKVGVFVNKLSLFEIEKEAEKGYKWCIYGYLVKQGNTRPYFRARTLGTAIKQINMLFNSDLRLDF